MMPDRLVASRTMNAINDLSALPFAKTIINRTQVQTLYAEILALPPFPTGGDGEMNCPIDLGLEYHFDFYSGDISLLSGDYTQLDARP
jgi:hypothetical protein